jgi:hypothetical protein
LGVGFAIVLAGPAALLWDAVRPEPWDLRTLRVRFESARYESAALVFTYRIENRTHRSVRLLPEVTRILVRQTTDRPPLGYPDLALPLELTAQSAQRIEVRLELPADRFKSLEAELPEEPPMQAKQSASPEPVSPEAFLDATLRDLNGFELVNESKGVHLLLPRGW